MPVNKETNQPTIIWTWVADSISYDNNRHVMRVSIAYKYSCVRPRRYQIMVWQSFNWCLNDEISVIYFIFLLSESYAYLAHLAGAVEYTDCISSSGKTHSPRVSWYDTTQCWRDSSLGDLRKVKYSFIAIVDWSTLTRSGSTW